MQTSPGSFSPELLGSARGFLRYLHIHNSYNLKAPAKSIMKHTLAIMLPLLLIAMLGVLANTPRTIDEPKDYLHVGASYMTFWGTGIDQDWSSGSVYQPILGNYNSSDANIASQHIEEASQHGIDFFFLDYGWGNDAEQKLMENAATNGLINATEGAGAAKNFSFCIFYFPNNRVNETTIDGNGLMQDFCHISETYFKYSSYLRLDGRYVVILADFPNYLNESKTLAYEGTNQKVSCEKINDLFLELKENYSLCLISTVWPRWNYTLQCAVLKDSHTRTLSGQPPVYDAITFWGDTTFIGNWNTAIDYPEYINRTEWNLMNWSDTAHTSDYNVTFVPFICPGYDNLIYYNGTDYHGGRPDWYAVVNRDLENWSYLWNLARGYAEDSSNKYHIVLIFTWNDFKEGTSIEPTKEYDSEYLNVIPEFPFTVLLPLFITFTLLAAVVYRKAHAARLQRPSRQDFNDILVTRRVPENDEK